MKHKQSFYEKYTKRFLDILLSLLALIVLSPLLIACTIIGAFKMQGNPFFTQYRPGRDEKVFKLIKFRTMTNKKDKYGNLLPDEERLTDYGRFLRSTSIDELPELLNILKGELSIVGPRPQLVKDMVFMTPQQRRRHSVTPGLTGLAQCNGRNNITWEEKINYDLKYIEKITFFNDAKIIFKTFFKVLGKDDIATDGMETAEDLGDYLLNKQKISLDHYRQKQKEAVALLDYD